MEKYKKICLSLKKLKRKNLHKIFDTTKKIVSTNSDCWTYENMYFSPLRKAKCRIMHIRGDGPTSIKKVNFKSKCSLNKSVKKSCNVSVNRDDPTFKSFQIDFDNEVSPNDWVDLDFSYYWENTWNLNSDFYSYDILSWTEMLAYDFELPESRKLTKVDGFLIDIFGNEWPGLGTINLSKNTFKWTVKRPPIFCSAIVKYESSQEGS